VAVAAPPAAATAGAPAATAPGAPGAPSYFDLARKDCVGTAANPGSKVWYTVAGGVLSDVYEPTIDNTDVSTLQYIVTDGATFTDLQTRDMTYTVAADRSGMACTVRSTDARHGFQLITTYITDPAHDLRRAVIARDRCCRFPGCDQPAMACQPHHIIPRSQGGPTSLTNLLLLCSFHHLIAVHRWGWGIVLLHDGTVTATNPDRTRTLRSHGPPSQAA
jgi:hypothetical protein